jgi:major membrane immunogen (membrane-anchored lipoprotein)
MTQSRFNAFFLSPAGVRHRGAAILAAVGLALLVAGCGGGGGDGTMSKAEFEQRVQKDGDQIRKAFTPLNTPPKSLNQLADELKTGEDELHKVADDLDKANPPKDVAEDTTKLATGLRKLAKELELMRTAAEKGDPALVQKALGSLRGSHALVDAQAATTDMKKKGYSLGTLGQ